LQGHTGILAHLGADRLLRRCGIDERGIPKGENHTGPLAGGRDGRQAKEQGHTHHNRETDPHLVLLSVLSGARNIYSILGSTT
jgi:hypothetical protein